MLKVCTEQALSKPRSMNAFCLCQRERKAGAEVMLPWKHRKKNSEKQLSYEIGCCLIWGVGQQTLLHCTYTAVQLLALHFGSIQNSIRASWVLLSPLYTTLKCGRCCFFLILVFKYHLEIYLLTYCAYSKQLWAIECTLRNLESSHFWKATYKAPHWNKVTFCRVINWLMALFHHRKWGQRPEI